MTKTPAIPKLQRLISWICRILVALILLQTLYFKFTGAEESVYIFEKLGMEPWGRYGSGIAELIAAILILKPKTVWMGAVLTLGIITGAIISHLGPLGIEVAGDGGFLFALAVVVEVCALIVLFIHRKSLPIIGKLL
jgi:uncharacterized membrane protein YphA (DoxX/SURF4 family)